MLSSRLQSGDIAHHLEFVSHRVRTQLDEIKRREVDRLNQIKKLLIAKQQQGKDGRRVGPGPGMGRLPGMPNLPAQVLDAVLKQQGTDAWLATHRSLGENQMKGRCST